MAFINEYISDEDMKRYKIKEIDEKFSLGGVASDSWTVDSSRKMYLRLVYRNKNNYDIVSTGWSFLWNEKLYYLETELIDSAGDRGAEGWSHKVITKVNFLNNKDEAINNDFLSSMMPDIRQAFEMYKDFGVFSAHTKYTLILDVKVL